VRYTVVFFTEFRHLRDHPRRGRPIHRGAAAAAPSDATAAGVRLRDHDGRLLRPLSNESINKTLVLRAAILKEAVRMGWLSSNPATERRLNAPRPNRPFLEQERPIAASALRRGGETYRR
jgi:hypothetical protein